MLSDNDLALIFQVDEFNVRIIRKLSESFRYKIVGVISRESDKSIEPNESSTNKLWYKGNRISFSPKYLNISLLNRKNVSKEFFSYYNVYVAQCNYVFQVHTPYAHGTFYNYMIEFLSNYNQ